MAQPASGRVTGLAVDPSDPSRPGELFRFNLDLVADRAEGDQSRPGDTFVFKTTPGDTSFAGWHDGFTGGVFVAGNGPELPHITTAPPAVQFEALIDDFANAQPVMAGDELSYSNSFTCIPASVP
jgi:hypothetical protein